MGVCFCMGPRASLSKTANSSKQNIDQLQKRNTVTIYTCKKLKTTELEVSYIPNKLCHTKYPFLHNITTYRTAKTLSTIDTICKSDKHKEDKITIHVIGQEETGKTSLVIRIAKNKFDPFYIPSINIETTEMKYSNVCTNEPNDFIFMAYNFSLFDSEKIKHDDFVLIVFDESNIKSLENSLKFIHNKKYMNNINKERLFLVGNKSDLKDVNFPERKLKAYCLENRIYFYEISVKKLTGVKQLFKKVCNIASDNCNIKELKILQ